MTIYGECENRGQRMTVRISELADTGCDLACETAGDMVCGELLLWIGAIGPLAVTAMRLDETHITARFKEPLDERILEHFAGD